MNKPRYGGVGCSLIYLSRDLRKLTFGALTCHGTRSYSTMRRQVFPLFVGPLRWIAVLS